MLECGRCGHWRSGRRCCRDLRRRRKFTFGQHAFLKCHQLEAVELLEIHIDELVTQVQHHNIGVFEVKRTAIAYHPPRYETD